MAGGGTGLPEESPTQEGGGGPDEAQVMSEVHLGCPPNHSGPHISHFTVALPPRKAIKRIGDGSSTVVGKVCEVDEDGDLILPRWTQQTGRGNDSFVITIQHHVTSSIPSVGLQVWGAELVLADFVLHMMYNSSKFDGIVAVDLGAGTDHDDEVLGNCAKNVLLNAGLFHEKASIYANLIGTIHGPLRTYRIHHLRKAAGDLTDSLFCILEVLMSTDREKVLYLALKKPYNFTMDDLDVVANGYSHFLSYLKLEDDVEEEDAEEECLCGFQN